MVVTHSLLHFKTILRNCRGIIMGKLDVVVLGATGFSGKYIVKMLAKLNMGITWGIAGRSQDRLSRLVYELKCLGVQASEIPVFICKTSDQASLRKVCEQTRLVINCIGPYTKLGYPVVEACIESGTHYIDLSVESYYILDLYQKYHNMAEEANALIIPACGLISILPITGLMHLDKQFPGTLKYVECYMYSHLPREALYPNSKNCLMHYTSLETVRERQRNKNEYQRLRKEILPKLKEPAEMKRACIHYRYRKIWYSTNVYPDEDIAKLSQQYLLEKNGRRPVPFKVYKASTLSLFFIIIIPIAVLFYFLLRFEWFRKLVHKYPRIFTFGYMSHEGPLEEVGKKTKITLAFVGKGWSHDVKDFSETPNESLELKVTAFDAYQTTADAAVASALAILKESSRMPRGGVVNIGAAFYETDIVKRLTDFGINFEIIK